MKYRFDASSQPADIARKVAHAMKKAPGVDPTVFSADRSAKVLNYSTLYYVRIKAQTELSELITLAPIVSGIQAQVDALGVPWGMIDGNDIRARFEVYAYVPETLMGSAGMSWSDMEAETDDSGYRRIRIGSWRILDLSKLLVSFDAWYSKNLQHSPLGTRVYAMRVYVGVLNPLTR